MKQQIQSSSKLVNNLGTLCLWTFGFCILLFLGALLLTSLFNVPMGDDYLAIDTYASLHHLPEKLIHSLTHTGRYTQSITAGLSYGLLQNLAPLVLSLIVLTGSFFIVRMYASRVLISADSKGRSDFVINLISVIAIVAIVTMGQPLIPKSTLYMYQAFFFSSAIVTYTIAWLATLILFYWYIFKKHRNRNRALVVLGFAIYLIFLSNETLPATLMLYSLVVIALSFIPIGILRNIKIYRNLFTTVAISGFAALITMYFSSGNAIRRKELGVTQDQNIIVATLEHVLNFLRNNLLQPSTISFVLLCAIMTYLLLRRSQSISKEPRRILLYSGLGSLLFFIISLCTAIALLIYGYGPHTAMLGRAMLLPMFSFYIGWALTVIYLLQLLDRKLMLTKPRHRASLAFALLIAIFGLALSSLPTYFVHITNHTRTVVTYESLWRTQDTRLREKAAANPHTPLIVPDQFSGIGDGYNLRCNSPYSIWLNVGMEAYYDVDRICSDVNGP